MDTILETSQAVESVRQAYNGLPERPKAEWVRGECPACGEPLVGNCYYVGGRGYLIVWQCWASLGPAPTCQYRKVL